VNVTAGSISLSSNWLYSFIADADGFFQLDYSIAAFGSDLSGLNGFRFSWSGDLQKTALFFPFRLGLEESDIIGNLVRPVTAGQIYTVGIENEVNIAGALGTRNTSMNATFSWDIIPVPEPPTLSILVIALAALMKWTFPPHAAWKRQGTGRDEKSRLEVRASLAYEGIYLTPVTPEEESFEYMG
jgi:hypothetical protein